MLHIAPFCCVQCRLINERRVHWNVKGAVCAPRVLQNVIFIPFGCFGWENVEPTFSLHIHIGLQCIFLCVFVYLCTCYATGTHMFWKSMTEGGMIGSLLNRDSGVTPRPRFCLHKRGGDGVAPRLTHAPSALPSLQMPANYFPPI